MKTKDKQEFRYSFLVDGRPSKWIDKKADEAEEIAREELGYSREAWSALKKSGKVKLNSKVKHGVTGEWESVLKLRTVR